MCRKSFILQCFHKIISTGIIKNFWTNIEIELIIIKNKLNLKKGSGVPQKDKVGNLTFDQVKEIAEEKMPDLNAVDLAGGMKIVQGTARASGVTTEIDGLTKEEVAAKLA